MNSVNDAEKMYGKLVDAEVGTCLTYRINNLLDFRKTLMNRIPMKSLAILNTHDTDICLHKIDVDTVELQVFNKDCHIYDKRIDVGHNLYLIILLSSLTNLPLDASEKGGEQTTPVHYRFTQHHFGIPKGSHFTVMSDWVEENLGESKHGLKTFITCTYWKGGKPEEVSFWMTKSQIRELIASGVIEDFEMDDRSIDFENTTKLYWRSSEAERKKLFELRHTDFMVHTYCYRPDTSLTIIVPSRYAPYSDELKDENKENPYEIFRKYDVDNTPYLLIHMRW